jgi:hypothetical protein
MEKYMTFRIVEDVVSMVLAVIFLIIWVVLVFRKK